MREIPRAAVIATHNRPAELRRCVEAIAPQVDLIMVVDNASSPPVKPWIENWSVLWHIMTKVLRDEEQPPNLSRLWNLGLNEARRIMGLTGLIHEVSPWHDLAVLNDDAIPPLGWFDAVAGAMREEGADAASSDPFDRLPGGERCYLWGAGIQPSVSTRLAGWAMMLRGEWDGARFDERFRWWCGDDDISHRARLAGGLVHVGGYPVPNTGADTSTTGVLAEQSARDMQAFVEKWGQRPW